MKITSHQPTNLMVKGAEQSNYRSLKVVLATSFGAA